LDVLEDDPVLPEPDDVALKSALPPPNPMKPEVNEGLKLGAVTFAGEVPKFKAPFPITFGPASIELVGKGVTRLLLRWPRA
jgi:hypothetical protein